MVERGARGVLWSGVVLSLCEAPSKHVATFQMDLDKLLQTKTYNFFACVDKNGFQSFFSPIGNVVSSSVPCYFVFVVVFDVLNGKVRK